MNRLKLPIGVLCAVAVLSMCGCKKKINAADAGLGKVHPVPETKDGSGWPVYQVADEGFSISLPTDWRRIDLDPAKLEAISKEMVQKNPQIQPMLTVVRQQMANGLKFFALDEGSMATGALTNVILLILPLPMGATLDTVIEQTKAQFQTMPAVQKPVDQKRLNTKAGECVRMQIKTKQNGLTDAQVATTQYHFLHGHKYYVLTLTTGSELEAKYASVFDQIGESLEFTK